jgi:hypothetical protein
VLICRRQFVSARLNTPVEWPRFHTLPVIARPLEWCTAVSA